MKLFSKWPLVAHMQTKETCGEGRKNLVQYKYKKFG